MLVAMCMGTREYFKEFFGIFMGEETYAIICSS